ncbi:hypothetical protein IWW52_001115 [Coemansia sp. RSA 2704]|nr:hypothetical protein IWW52_001115 [Coemansia sp. RSA 2704]
MRTLTLALASTLYGMWLSTASARSIVKGCPGYSASHVTTTSHGLHALLTLNGPPCNIYGQDIADLALTVRADTDSRLHIHISDTANTQFQIPESVLPLDKGAGTDKRHSSLQFVHTHSKTSGFGFKVLRGGKPIFDTTGHPLVFEDQYLELTSNVPADANIYGLGESPNWFRRDPQNTTITLWNRDVADPLGENVYGSHSVFMELRDEQFHGCYLHNSHGMDVILANQTVQFRVLGGTLDLYFFAGPSALSVVDQYTQLVGRPNRIPYWALGFHNCRFGYTGVGEVNQVIANYSAARIPLEAAWTDIEYMDSTRDFTFDNANYPLDKMRKQLDYLHARGQKMVLITDPAIHVNDSYGTYTRGQELDVFIKNADGSEYIGQVWPGYTTFPDWFAPNVSRWWNDELKRYFEALPIDGMWIDMNEPASFCIGSCGSGRPRDEVPTPPWVAKPPGRPLDRNNRLLVPPYAINNHETELSSKTVETIAVHANGVAEYHVHNLYGLMESRATYDFLRAYRPNVRPFVLSRSTFAGSGALVSHWTGDNAATWQDLHVSIASTFDFGIFGIPMVGADICGFYRNTTEELCARWVQLGAFYPFSRSHNSRWLRPQEPYRWPSVAESARRALGVRYALLSYIYTCYQNAVERGWPVARPLVFEYPHMTETAGNDRQMLVGDSILVSPVLLKGDRSVDAFFPPGRWFDWYNHSLIDGIGANVTLDAPLEHINVHIRGGRIVPVQQPEMTTAKLRQNDFELIVAADADGTAAGQLYMDDGETLDTPHRWLDFNFYQRSLWIDQRSGTYAISRPLAKLVLLGVHGVRDVFVNGVMATCAISASRTSTVITGLSIDLNRKSRVTFA